MSFQAMTWACAQELPCNQKMVLLMLANRTNPDSGQCTPSHERLTRDCGLSKTTVKECIARLETAGLLEILRRSNEGVSLPNAYKLVMDEVGRQAPHQVGLGEGVGRQPTDGGAPDDRGVGRQPATKQRVETEKGNGERKQGLAAPADVSEAVWRDFLTLRKAKQAPVTQIALDGIAREAVKASLSLEDALRMCCERGWRGFRAEWVNRDAGGAVIRTPQRMTRADHRADFMQQMTSTGEHHADDHNGVVEVEARVVSG